MRIRSQLAALIGAVIAPVALLAVLATTGWYDAQQEVHAQRYLERVRALRLALDTEIQGTVRLLRIFGERQQLTADAAPTSADLDEPLRRLMRSVPTWSSIAVVELDGAVSAGLQRPEGASASPLDEAARRQAIDSARPALSDLVSSADGTGHHTFLAVPVVRDGRVLRLVVVDIPHASWLGFLRSYPIAADATLTLNDGALRIVARTLNNEKWVGKSSSADFRARVEGKDEGAFINTGLEGQRFYTAFSRLESAPWTLGTGVPAEAVEAPARRQALLVAASVLVAALAAVALTMRLERRITHAFTSLAELLPMSDAEREQALRHPLHVSEAESVRGLLRDTLQARAHALAAAEQARAQAETANAAKDEFVAMLAHELRNPLSAMATSVSLLESPRATPESDLHARQVLRRQVNQATLLVDDLLDTARVNAGQIALRLAPVDLAQVAASVAQTFVEPCRAKELELELQVERAPVRADAMRLEQVVSNLLHNAVKFSHPGGRIGVSVHAAEGMAVLHVRDDGAGISAELLPRVFEPYTQADAGLDRARGGLGLGLYLVQRLVAMHGGSVSARSDGVGHGALFEVRLPLQAPTQAAAVADGIPELNPLRVVVVEDHPDVREAVVRLLRSVGHEVHAAERGDEGLALLRREAPEVALIDLGLPGLDGFELVRRLRAEPAGAERTLLLALTAYGDEASQSRALEAGFDALLPKPFDLGHFNRLLLGRGWGRRAADGRA